jgi:hypothetical protein
LLDRLDRWGRKPWLRYAAYVVGFFFVATLAALAELNGLLLDTHLPSAPSFGIGSLSDFGLHWPHSGSAFTAVQTWCGANSTAVTNVLTTAHREIGVDCFFALVYPAAAGILLLKAHERLGRVTVAQGRTELAKVYRRVALIGLVCVPVVAAADLVENVAEYGVLNAWTTPKCDVMHVTTAWFPVLAAAAWVKYFAGLVVALSVVLAALALVLLTVGAPRRIFRAFLAARGPLIVVGLFGLIVLIDPTGQAGDGIRVWQDHWSEAIAPFVLAVVLGWLSGLETRRVLTELRKPRKAPRTPALVTLLVAGALVFALGLVARSAWGTGKGLVIPGLVMVVLAAASFALPDVKRIPRELPTGFVARELPAAVAALPAIVLGYAVFRAAFAELAYAEHPQFAWLVAIGVALQLVGWGSYALLRRIAPEPSLEVLIGSGVACGAVGVGVLIWVIANPWSAGGELGTLGLLAAFFTGVGALAYALIELSERIAAPQALAALRIERIPWFGFFLLWLVLAAVIDSSTSYYDVRVLDRQSRTAKQTPEEAFRRWTRSDSTQRPAPLLFVSTSGGGIRAAYWTAIVLDCVLEGQGAPACMTEARANDRARRAFFAASGISGGSLGLVAYEAHLSNTGPGPDWPAARLGGEYLAPTVGWALFVDLPLALLRRDGGTDRAEVLERAWERSWVDSKGAKSTLAQGLFAAERVQPYPLLLLNGTKVQDSCRFETSVLDGSIKLTKPGENNETLVEDCRSMRLFESSSDRYVQPEDRPGWTFASSEDLVDYLCPRQDVRLSTAALMSARFPYILPSGRLQKCDGSTAVNLVDGGYFDTSGASPVVELWDRLRPLVDVANRNGRCIVPVYLQIDNGYASEPSSTKSSRPWESSVPLETLRRSRDAREANARQAAALAFGAPSLDGTRFNGPDGAVDRVAHIYPRAHPGSKAPLGWTLSDASMEDLRVQLQTEANRLEIEKVRKWFSTDLTCKREAAR